MIACELCGSEENVTLRRSSLGECYQCEACVQAEIRAYLLRPITGSSGA